MKANKQRYQYSNYSYEGNTARKLQVLPEYEGDEEREYRPQPKKQPVRRVRKRPKANVGIDLFSLFILTLAIGVTLYTCVDYLRVQADITQMSNDITSMERNLTKLQNENNAALSKINTSLDLNYIYQVATTELGMIYPGVDQVVTYESNLSDYLRQYKEIPEDNTNTLLDKVFK